MFIHYTGYTLNFEPRSKEAFIYTLSTESNFCYELLDSYWTGIHSPTNFDDSFYSLNLMAYSDYYLYRKSPNFPINSRYVPYITSNFPKKFLIYENYLNFLVG